MIGFIIVDFSITVKKRDILKLTRMYWIYASVSYCGFICFLLLFFYMIAIECYLIIELDVMW